MLCKQICTVLVASAVCGVSMAQRSDTAHLGAGSAGTFLERYQAFSAEQQRSGPEVLAIGLGHVKGLSRSFSGSSGSVVLNLRSGSFVAALRGLSPGQAYSLWLVDQDDTSPVSALAQAQRWRLARIEASGPSAAAAGSLAALPRGFQVDRVVLARGDSVTDVVASGSMSVLQKLFFAGSGREQPDAAGPSRSLPFAGLVPAVLPGIEKTDDSPLDVLISQGRTLFFEQTFNGNGRTCGTCHPANRNFTIDPAFIATLPATDPLFVAEFNPALAQLERPVLMRQFGLILENVDGLDNPTQKFTMRSVPHTLGLQRSLQRDPNNPAHPAQMTGWSGDGAPGAGALRDFAIGAVTQHFPKTLNRNEGPDFNLPNNQQLDAMEAFQLSLGRSTDFDLTKVTFLDAGVAAGQNLFVNGTGNPEAAGRCAACHADGGALVPTGENRNFNTNVEDVVHPARSVLDFPIDGGFGATPANTDGSFGNRQFNTPPVVEAADTAPFFHNNVVTTLEGVIGFYTGNEFNGPRGPAARFSFTATEATNVVNFMRGLNTLQNIDVARRALQEVLALSGNPVPEVQARLQSALGDTGDAIGVLNQGSLFPAAVTQLTSAQQSITQARQTSNPNQRAALIGQAIAALDAAKGLVATIAP